MTKFRLPSRTERVAIFGRTGSGKSVFALWLLSLHSIEDQPWVILDYKKDKYLRSIPYIREIDLGEIPKHAGIHIIDVDPKTDDGEVDDYLYSLLKKGNIGLFCDESASIPQREPKYRGLKSVFAQGRSKKVPVILATQRPSWINQSVLSEADYFATFHLAKADDRARTKEFMPDDVERRLDDYHSHWYDVKKDELLIVKPVNEEQTFDRLSERLKPKVRLI